MEERLVAPYCIVWTAGCIFILQLLNHWRKCCQAWLWRCNIIPRSFMLTVKKLFTIPYRYQCDDYFTFCDSKVELHFMFWETLRSPPTVHGDRGSILCYCSVQHFFYGGDQISLFLSPKTNALLILNTFWFSLKFCDLCFKINRLKKSFFFKCFYSRGLLRP